MSQDSQDLKLKSNPLAEEFTASSPKRPRTRIARYHLVDGLGELDKLDFLPRASLVEKVLDRTRESGLLIISSPPPPPPRDWKDVLADSSKGKTQGIKRYRYMQCVTSIKSPKARF